MAGLFFGVKATSSDLRLMLSISQNIEIHCFEYELSSELPSLANEIQHLALHAPIRVNKNDIFDLSLDGVHRNIADSMIYFSEKFIFNKEKHPIIFHAPGLDLKNLESKIIKVSEFFNFHSVKKSITTIENLPAYSWVGKKLSQTGLFHRPKDFEKLLDLAPGAYITLDICHFFMGRHTYNDFDDFVNSFSSRIKHIHISDLKLSDPYSTEGLQISKGDLVFDKIFDSISVLNGNIMLVPEIKGGHRNSGSGFKCALRKLKKFI